MSTHKLELRSIRINERLSEETTCFAATLYVDGKRAAVVGNHGHGGAIFFPQVFDKALLMIAEAEAVSRPSTRAFGMDIPASLELVVFGLVEDERQRQFVARETMLRRRVDRRQVRFAVDGEFKMLGLKPPHPWGRSEVEKTVAEIKRRHPTARIFCEMTKEAVAQMIRDELAAGAQAVMELQGF